MNCVILNDVHDAEYLVLNRTRFEDCILVSTHESVNDYLSSHGIPCESLSSYITEQDVLNNYKDADKVSFLLAELDAEFGEALNQLVNEKVELSFFHAFYRYLGRYEYMNILKVQAAVSQLVRKRLPSCIYLFQSPVNKGGPSFFTTSLNVYKLLSDYLVVDLKIIPTTLLQKEKRQKNHSSMNLQSLVNNLLTLNPSRMLRKFFLKSSTTMPIAVQMNLSSDWIILVNGISSANLLPALSPVSLLTGKVLTGNFLSDFQVRFSPVKTSIQNKMIELKGKFKPVDFDINKITQIIFLEDFLANAESILGSVMQLNQLAQTRKIKGGVWVSPPIGALQALIVEYLLKSGYVVIGRQHGGNYGIEVSHPKHFDSDYEWCTHYLSYGFTKEDLKESSPELKPRCEILPVGEKKLAIRKNEKKLGKIDVLFPISNATPFHQEGVRPLPHVLAKYQIELIKFLDQLTDWHVVIKPFPGYSQENSAFVEFLNSLKHVEILEHMSFSQVMNNYKVDTVLIEYPSSPLYECLRDDVEILSLKNPLLPLNSTATRLLNERVHFYDDIPAIQNGILDSLHKKLPHLRDSAFVDRYLHSSDSININKLINKIFEMPGVK
ncbi:MAG: hypothetical protein U0Z26_12525 [Anaerolineales bacterium]